MLKKLVLFLSLFGLTSAAIASGGAIVTPSGGTVVMAVTPSTSQMKVGDTLEIAIEVQAGSQDVDGASAYLNFDPTYLEVVDMTAGGDLSLELENSFDNGAGTINYAAGKLTAPYPSGNFDLVTIRLTAKAETTGTSLEFQSNPPRRTNVTFNGASVFDHAENGSITVTVEKSELQFSSAAYTVTEGGQATITVTRTVNSDGAVSVDYATSDDTATAPDDYTQTSDTLNWSDGDDADKTFTIDITDDSVQEDNEKLIISLGNPTGGAILGEPDTATVTIRDNDTTGTVILSVEPAEPNVVIGQEFDVNILVKAETQKVDGASAYLNFDPTYLEVVSMTTGGRLDLTFEESFDNGTGHINFAAGKLTIPFPDGDFKLVTIRLKAKAETAGTALEFIFNPPRRTDATFGGTSVFDYAENGLVQITVAAQVTGNVELQGRAAKPDASWETEVRVSFTVPSETEPRYSFTRTTDQNGQFQVGPVEPLTYDIRVKGTHTLQNLVESVSLVPGDNTVDVGTLLEGDANDDNCTAMVDFSIFVGTFGKCEDDSGFDSRANFNQDNCVDIRDFSLLATNFGRCGAPDPSLMVSSLMATPNGTVEMSIVPSTSQVNVGETFEIAINVQAGEQEVDSASAYLDFDPTYLEVVNMTSGDHLNLTLENSFDNGAGSINFAAGKLAAPFPYGDFELVTIRLRAKAATARTPLGFVFNPSRRTDATFSGASVFDYAEDGSIGIN
jgi:hypothetical protein